MLLEEELVHKGEIFFVGIWFHINYITKVASLGYDKFIYTIKTDVERGNKILYEIPRSKIERISNNFPQNPKVSRSKIGRIFFLFFQFLTRGNFPFNMLRLGILAGQTMRDGGKETSFMSFSSIKSQYDSWKNPPQ